MDGSRFDSWTRRRVNLTVGGIAASLIGLASITPLAAKKKRKKKKRCKKLGTTCVPSGKRKCCKGVACTLNEGGVARCCRGTDGFCSTDTDCCSFNCDVGACGLPLV